ncbi:MAG: 2,3-bisphosphoglycerate-independent phosphoglycerate mutase, partial [Saprospiraceae bacterium]|nr:2,3-bisphosphoglycerate-independent phosphoglycerate mutase [Saprospiraceae bacterium]
MLTKFDKTALIILDGWGHGLDPKANAIAKAKTPFTDSLYDKYPNTELITFGEEVGLPEGQMGNSEVGHLNIGAGRIVYQELARINKAIKDKTLDTNPNLLEALRYAKNNKKKIHLLGLISDGGVHSHLNHLKALCQICENEDVSDVYIHAFMDGRDTDPKNGAKYMQDLQAFIQDKPVQIASVIGRYYAMDRDKRWERIRLAYDLLVHGKGEAIQDPLQGIQAAYEAGTTDEFLLPMVCTNADGAAVAKIEADDVILCYNFRTDRCRQITQALHQEAFEEHGMQPLPLYYCTMTRYDERFEGIKVLFEKDDIPMTLGEVLAKANKTQIRIAETEKYPHVTFFLNGGKEKPYKNERRILCPSPKVATYDKKPEM